MFEKKPLMVENTSVKTWKTHLEPSPNFLYSKEMNVLVAPPILKGCLAIEKGKRENERKMEASTIIFFEYKKLSIQSLLLGYFIPPNPIQIKHYYIGRKWEKHKNSKIQRL